MLIRVLGCSGAIAAGCRTTSFLLDGDVLVDAGTGVGDLTLAELARIDHIPISHSHLDHVLAIGLLADSVIRFARVAGRPAIQVHASRRRWPLRAHIFNGVVWPDFTRLPSARHPVLELSPSSTASACSWRARRSRSSVPATPSRVRLRGQGAAGWWVYTGDTGPNPALWRRLRELKVADLVIETAFGDVEHELANLSRHLCPSTLGHELAALSGPLNASVNVHITHIKPGEMDAVMAEIGRMPTPHTIRPSQPGS